MKKSNKLLIVLFLFIAVTLFFFNVLLNEQVKAGNFRNEYYSVTRKTLSLKPFKHVVYDGRMFLHQARYSASWVDRTLYLNVGERKTYELEMPSTAVSLLSYYYHGDTLFLDFSKQVKRADYVPESSILMHLFAPELSSVSSLSGAMMVTGVRQEIPMALYFKNSQNFMLYGLNLSVLQLHADSLAEVRVVDSSSIDTLALTMGIGSRFTVTEPNNIGTIIPMQLHSSARISMEGKANDMKTYLQKTQ